jgi:mannan endo-1,4-beta-mannosidase
MAAIRKATADRAGDAISPEPVSPGASSEAKALLARLSTVPGQVVLTGQENDPASPTAATAAVVQATGKQPAIYATDLGSIELGAEMGYAQIEIGLAQLRKEIVREAIRAHAGGALVSLSWHPSRPAVDAPADAKNRLTDYEWNDLLTPGTALNQRWHRQVDSVAETLRELEKAGIPVLWNPLPESNGPSFWWAGRKGIHGSAELYRQLLDRLVNHDGLHNLIWVWEAAAPEFRPSGGGPAGPGPLSDYFPGYLYTDALEIRLNQLSTRFPASRFVSQIALEKPIGVELSGDLPAPAALTQNSGFAWFLVAPPVSASADSNARTEALRTLYGDPHVVSLAPAQ